MLNVLSSIEAANPADSEPAVLPHGAPGVAAESPVLTPAVQATPVPLSVRQASPSAERAAAVNPLVLRPALDRCRGGNGRSNAALESLQESLGTPAEGPNACMCGSPPDPVLLLTDPLPALPAPAPTAAACGTIFRAPGLSSAAACDLMDTDASNALARANVAP
jgi:hypothetical protein